MPQIFDNIEISLLPALQQTLQLSRRADFCSGYFNLRGWKSVADIVGNWSGAPENRCRLIVGMQRLPAEELRLSRRLIQREAVMDNATALRLKKALAAELREQLTIGLPTDADRDALLQLAEHLKSGKLVVKGHLRHPLHAKLYLCHRDDPINPVVGYLGSSNFTLSGLDKQGELNVDVLDGDACQKLCRWFEDRWEDRWSLDISKVLIAIVESSWVHPVHPYHIYLKMAYHLAREARAGVAEFEIPREFGAELFDFQAAAVKIAAHHLNARGGVVLGDVVGLGKTIMACALAAIFQSPPYFLETLVLCPANLVPMWEEALARHRILGKVLSIALAHKLDKERRYRLLIIDESHNLRAGEGSRYRSIADYIEQNEPRVVLLSATPYNKHYGDLFHQLRLFLPADKSLGLRPERLLGDMGLAEFMARHQAAPDTLAAFGHSSHADDWRELMRLYLVRRTRSFIKANYTHDGDGRKYLRLADGEPFYFPARVAKTVPFPLDEKNPDDQYARLYSARVVDAINALHLPRYGLANYLKDVFPTPLNEAEIEIVENLSRAGKRLMGFCRTNLFKRLESSGAAFLLSVARHIRRNDVFLHALQNDLPLPIGAQDAALLDAAFNDEDENDDPQSNAAAIYEFLAGARKKRFQWLRADVFAPSLQKALQSDNATLREVLQLAGDWNAATDRKLDRLFQLAQSTHGGDKVLVFSQFADTVRYLEKELKAHGVEQLYGVTGSDENPTAAAHRFSPRSNGAAVAAGDELRVLIATDVLSEGQNLQDAHIVINYDLPWAIIRLIQRAGRVDRIGQSAPEITCYSFLPAEGVEKLIDLRGRLKNRLQENAEVIGSDEQFFEDEAAHELRDLYHEKAGILDEDDDGEVDLASHAFQIWKNASDADPSLRKIIPALPDVVEGARSTPNALTSGSSPEGRREKGVVVYTRTPGETDALVWMSPGGEVLTQSQWQILRAAACDASTPPAPLASNHHQLVENGVRVALEIEKNLGGSLGKPSGARYKAWHVLKRYHESVKGTLFDTPQLQQVADAIHKSPLKQNAADAINAQFKIKASDEHLAQLLMILHEENRLVQSEDDENENAEPRLICSLGLV
jgi:superfamily II DNA or RNA helicase